ncbi:Ectonucleotide pyrophosphatase/phosphodiesterase family member 7 [Pteropus alecto]|uniref:Ectonucleotide pyrophosphatase/phosphodiesterase family member 7 n=1 Tax=Pteropus alecto TaxID=9402 RepID=L5KNS8_PTEAL|nr:Ectonucleotide pyrophosphatase/phosphodiesterase family member 7 [Pteropus alecto]
MRCSAILLAVVLATPPGSRVGVPVRRQGSRNKLLLVSLDGFHWNDDQDGSTPNLDGSTPNLDGSTPNLDGSTPNLDAKAHDGVKARYVTPTFVTMTGPCHFTLVTGRYIENMYNDTASGVKLPCHATLGVQRWWDHGSVPIWITAQRQREDLGLAALCLGEPDSTGSKYGPESQEGKEMVMRVDGAVGYLRDSIGPSGLESSLDGTGSPRPTTARAPSTSTPATWRTATGPQLQL